MESLAKQFGLHPSSIAEILLPNLQNLCSLFHSQSCRVIESFFHFPAKYCTGSNMFIKTMNFVPVHQDSPASYCQGSLDLWGPAQTSLPGPSGTTSSSVVPNSKTEYFRNVCSNLCFIFLMHPVLESLFICIHLLVTWFFSVDKVLCLLVFNWLKKSRVGSPPPQSCPSAYHIPWPRVLNFSSPIADVATLHFQELT